MRHPGLIIAGVLAAGALAFVALRSRKPAPAPAPTAPPAAAPPAKGTAGLVAGLAGFVNPLVQLGQGQGWWQ